MLAAAADDDDEVEVEKLMLSSRCWDVVGTSEIGVSGHRNRLDT